MTKVLQNQGLGSEKGQQTENDLNRCSDDRAPATSAGAFLTMGFCLCLFLRCDISFTGLFGCDPLHKFP
jgi:hypothetical protein